MAGAGVGEGVGESVEVGVNVGNGVDVAAGVMVAVATATTDDRLGPQLAANTHSNTRQIDALCFLVFILDSYPLKNFAALYANHRALQNFSNLLIVQPPRYSPNWGVRPLSMDPCGLIQYTNFAPLHHVSFVTISR